MKPRGYAHRRDRPGRAFSYGCNYDLYYRERQVRAAQQAAAFTLQQAMLKKKSAHRALRAACCEAAQCLRASRSSTRSKLDPPRVREIVPSSTATAALGHDVARCSTSRRASALRVVYDGFRLRDQSRSSAGACSDTRRGQVGASQDGEPFTWSPTRRSAARPALKVRVLLAERARFVGSELIRVGADRPRSPQATNAQ